jgi:hypothetical protein
MKKVFTCPLCDEKFVLYAFDQVPTRFGGAQFFCFNCNSPLALPLARRIAAVASSGIFMIGGIFALTAISEGNLFGIPQVLLLPVIPIATFWVGGVVALTAPRLVVSGRATSTSTAVGSSSPAWKGPILVSPAEIPSGIEYEVIGSVQANANDSAANLYPLLAAEAKKIGANAVVNANGGRRVTPFSWSAPYVSGIAVKVDDPQILRGLPGSYH